MLCASLVLAASSCTKKLDTLLDTQSQTILTDDQIYNDPKLITNVLAGLYNRLPKHATLAVTPENFTTYDEAMWSGLSNNDLEVRNNLLKSLITIEHLLLNFSNTSVPISFNSSPVN
jgi:hypothetical protein